MKICISIPSFNQAAFLQNTIESALKQRDDIDVFVADGGSTDGTTRFLSDYRDSRLNYVTEKDSGQTEAINKGFRRCSGEIVCWMNSDDVFVDGAFARVIKEFSNDPDLDVLCGDKYHIDENGNVLSVQRYAPYLLDTFANEKMVMCNQACFWRRSVFDKIGYLDESLRFVMDLEFFIRMGTQSNLKIRHIPVVLGAQRYYEGTKTSDVEWNKVWRSEREAVIAKYGLKRSAWRKWRSRLHRAWYHIRTGHPLYLVSNRA